MVAALFARMEHPSECRSDMARRFSSEASGVYLLPQLALVLERGCTSMIVCTSGRELNSNGILVHRRQSSTSLSVKSAALVNQAVGYDAGKHIKGRKRFMSVDTLGLVLRVFVTAASVGDRVGGKGKIKRVKRMGKQVSRLHTIWVDGGNDCEPFMQWIMDCCR